ncbi:dehydratase [Brevibacillus choshinensis]|uniref:Dehydratase n=1 Tax=Brevibacillus choshinensis TaxID=54911 RepID=A0ABR5NAR8_BRECH|nr:MaoC/PaaZ C-terminal domain-containing protein [Brevibacillus choshinensis]KQL48612.1 dehydratase [Brevibacillus choshinensis]
MQTVQIDWAHVEVGHELEPLVKPAISKVQLLKYAGASGDFNLIHTDVETAREVGLPGTIAHGMLSMGFLGQYAGQLAGTSAFVSELKVRFAGMVFPGDVLTCRAKVVKKEAGKIELQLGVERESGKALTSGEATLTLL